MNIKVPQIPLYTEKQQMPQAYRNPYLYSNTDDCFVRQCSAQNVSFGKGLFGDFIAKLSHTKNNTQQQTKIETKTIVDQDELRAVNFQKRISMDMQKVLGEKVPYSNLSSIMNPSEVKKLLPKLTVQNFLSTEENINNGMYFIDLDYQTTHSSGNDNVYDMLDKVADYAEEYYERHKKPFIFAITDRDSVEGIQHAVRIIGQDPDKFKHVKIIPGIKMSYTHKAPNSQQHFENSEMLIYGINPFSENLIETIDKTINSRKQMVVDFIKQVCELYPEYKYRVLEFVQQNGIRYKKAYGVSNLYWRVREYAETKGDLSIKGIKLKPEENLRDVAEIMSDLGKVFVGSNANTGAPVGTRIIKDDGEVNKEIKKIFDFYATHEEKNPVNNQEKIVSVAENVYTDMIDCLSKEVQKPVLALASPYYLSHYFEPKDSKEFPNVVNFINELKEGSKGMLMAFESVAPFYDLDKELMPERIKLFNDYLRNNTDLYEVGGSFAKLQI